MAAGLLAAMRGTDGGNTVLDQRIPDRDGGDGLLPELHEGGLDDTTSVLRAGEWYVGAQPTASPIAGPSPEPEPTNGAVAAAVPTTDPVPLTGIEALVCSRAWSCPVALCIVRRESNFHPEAINPSSGTVGLFQIRPSVHAWRWESRGWTYADMQTAEPNIEIAWELYSEQGWSPWNGSPSCWS